MPRSYRHYLSDGDGEIPREISTRRGVDKFKYSTHFQVTRSKAKNANKEEKKLRKMMLLASMLAVAMIAVAPALAQDEPAVSADATAPKAKAGGAFAEAECKDGVIEAKAGA